MFLHNFKYGFKLLLRNRMLVFYTYAFPIILGLCFFMAFSNIDDSNSLDIQEIAIVDNTLFQSNEAVKGTFEQLGKKENKERLFNIRYTNEKTAKKLLSKRDIIGYFKMDGNGETKKQYQVFVEGTGYEETILTSVVEEIMQSVTMVETMIETQVEQAYQSGNMQVDIERIVQQATSFYTGQAIKMQDDSRANFSFMSMEFITLIAMACLFGATFGMSSINNFMANMNATGKRVSVAPSKKAVLVLSSLIASFIVQIIGVGLLLILILGILRVDLGNRIEYILLLCLVASLAGLCFGTAVGALIKKKLEVKISIITSFTMLGSFLSGMMGVTMKHLVDSSAPIVNMLNPANMITDGLYSLYYFESLDRYYFNIGSLLIFSLIMIGLAMFGLRRQKYESI